MQKKLVFVFCLFGFLSLIPPKPFADSLDNWYWRNTGPQREAPTEEER
jgi:hypothetical protein